MLSITDPSTGPPGGSFKLKNPLTGNSFAHPNVNTLYYYFRKDCSDNGFAVPEVPEMEAMLCAQTPNVCSDRMRGLGDAVAYIAQPIAGAIDAVLGTNVRGCGGCVKRKDALNRAVPFK